MSVHIIVPWLRFEIVFAIQAIKPDEDEELDQEPAFKIGFS